ncbi:hypothetical protein LZ30DRAFT_689212 [Colletotrichum cereale]|nr:hypothetical protein LZ30DRAFT_689212 [Colletotrichum cereale]
MTDASRRRWPGYEPSVGDGCVIMVVQSSMQSCRKERHTHGVGFGEDDSLSPGSLSHCAIAIGPFIVIGYQKWVSADLRILATDVPIHFLRQAFELCASRTSSETRLSVRLRA